MSEQTITYEMLEEFINGKLTSSSELICLSQKRAREEELEQRLELILNIKLEIFIQLVINYELKYGDIIKILTRPTEHEKLVPMAEAFVSGLGKTMTDGPKSIKKKNNIDHHWKRKKKGGYVNDKR